MQLWWKQWSTPILSPYTVVVEPICYAVIPSIMQRQAHKAIRREIAWNTIPLWTQWNCISRLGAFRTPSPRSHTENEASVAVWTGKFVKLTIEHENSTYQPCSRITVSWETAADDTDKAGLSGCYARQSGADLPSPVLDSSARPDSRKNAIRLKSWEQKERMGLYEANWMETTHSTCKYH